MAGSSLTLHQPGPAEACPPLCLTRDALGPASTAEPPRVACVGRPPQRLHFIRRNSFHSDAYGAGVNACPSLTGLIAKVWDALPVFPALSVTRVVTVIDVLPAGGTNDPPTTQVAVVRL